MKNVLFMGTPDFAVESLKALNEADYSLTVITQQDKPKGRGYALLPTPVKEYAISHGIVVYQPQTLRGEEFASLLSEINPDIIVVAAYGKILPQNVLDYPKYGCINVHGSLLPKYRGAAPIQRAIMNGEKETGVTIMQMSAGLDTGDMLYQVKTPITDDDDFESVFNRMSDIGSKALIKALELLEKGVLKHEKQDDSLSCYAEKIEKSDCLIDFSLPADLLFNRIRGLSPFPLAYTYLDGSVLKIIKSKVLSYDSASDAVPGTVLSLGNEIAVACGKGLLSITDLLPAGKRRMSAADFINGKKIKVGDLLGISPEVKQ